MAFDNETQRRRLHGHGKHSTAHVLLRGASDDVRPSTLALSAICFSQAAQRFASVTLTFRPLRALADENRRQVVQWLASRVGVAVPVVCLGESSDDAHGMQLPVTIGPLPSGAAETVGDKLVACTSDLAELVKIFGVPMVAVERPRLEPQLWSFSEAVLYAAGTTANPN